MCSTVLPGTAMNLCWTQTARCDKTEFRSVGRSELNRRQSAGIIDSRNNIFIAKVVSLWPPYLIGQTIIFLPCGFFFCLLYFPRLISAVADWMSTILPHMVWPCANLRCRFETCCTRLAKSSGRKKSPKIRHLGTVAQLCWAISSQLRHVSTIGKMC